MKKIPIFFTFDDAYAVPAAVAFYSLLNKAKDGVFYEMHVLHSDVTQESQAMLRAVVSRFQNASLTFRNTDGFLRQEWEKGNFDGHQQKDRFSLDVIVRCFAARFFPQYDKIIYSDVDIVVQDDISELFDIDLTDKYLAGVKSASLKEASSELSHLKSEHREMLKDTYFGGGILVMNLQKIRQDNLEEKMIAVIRDDTIVKKFPNQDVLNIVCENKVAYLPLNYVGLPYLLGYLKRPDFVSHYSRDELYDSIISPKIIHYAGFKPWNREVAYWEFWWSVYYYLNLPRTSLITTDYARFKNRIKRLQRINKILSIALAFTAAAVLSFLFFG